jgi:hypothetical protein
MKNTIILLFLITICNKSFAGKPDSLLNYFEDLKTRTLLVCLQTESAKTVEKFTKKGDLKELELYRNGIKSTNTNLMNAVKLFWKLNSNIKFIPVDSLDWFKTNFPKKYGYLTLSSADIHSAGAIHVGIENVPSFSRLGLHLFLCDQKRSIAYSNFPNDEIGQDIPKELKENNVLYSNYYLSSSKFIYALYRIDWFYKDLIKGIRPWMGSRNAINSGGLEDITAYNIKNKILVARLQDCEKGFDLEKAKKYYPYKIQIVSDEEFEKCMMNKNPEMICFFVGLVSSSSMGGGGATMTKLIYMQQAINCNDGIISTGFAGSFGLNYKVLEGFIDIMERNEKMKQKNAQKNK